MILLLVNVLFYEFFPFSDQKAYELPLCTLCNDELPKDFNASPEHHIERHRASVLNDRDFLEEVNQNREFFVLLLFLNYLSQIYIMGRKKN